MALFSLKVKIGALAKVRRTYRVLTSSRAREKVQNELILIFKIKNYKRACAHAREGTSIRVNF